MTDLHLKHADEKQLIESSMREHYERQSSNKDEQIKSMRDHYEKLLAAKEDDLRSTKNQLAQQKQKELELKQTYDQN